MLLKQRIHFLDLCNLIAINDVLLSRLKLKPPSTLSQSVGASGGSNKGSVQSHESSCCGGHQANVLSRSTATPQNNPTALLLVGRTSDCTSTDELTDCQKVEGSTTMSDLTYYALVASRTRD
jgi:hypothetical protein